MGHQVLLKAAVATARMQVREKVGDGGAETVRRPDYGRLCARLSLSQVKGESIPVLEKLR